MLELDPNDDPPAVVNLLVHRGRVSGEALPATVLDLAARGYLQLDEIGPGQFLCRLVRRPPVAVALTAFETRTLALLRARAVDGTVPADALTLGAGDETSAWWTEFEQDVRRDAMSRGVIARLGPFDLVLLLDLIVVALCGVVFVSTSNQTIAAISVPGRIPHVICRGGVRPFDEPGHSWRGRAR